MILTGTNDFIFQDATPEEAFQNLIHMANTAALHGIRPIFMTPLPVDEPMATERWMQGYGISYARVNEELRAFAALVRNSGTKYLDLNRLYPECGQYIDGSIRPLQDTASSQNICMEFLQKLTTQTITSEGAHNT